LALSIEDADAMIAAAAEAGRTHAVNRHLRASQVAAGAVGAPRLIRTFHRCQVRAERRANRRFIDPARGAGASRPRCTLAPTRSSAPHPKPSWCEPRSTVAVRVRTNTAAGSTVRPS
jgi:hypothetical protein